MNFRKKSVKARNKRMPRRIVLITFIAIISLVFGITAFALNDSSKEPTADSESSSEKTTSPQPTTVKGENSITPSQSDKQTSTSNSTSETSNTSTSPLIKPYGTFVSNHKPGQNSSPLQEESMCNTTPSAYCSIIFSKDGVIKSLPLKQTDSSGSVFWSWTPKSIGLTAGSWLITAEATQQQQSASTRDPITLDVLP